MKQKEEIAKLEQLATAEKMVWFIEFTAFKSSLPFHDR